MIVCKDYEGVLAAWGHGFFGTGSLYYKIVVWIQVPFISLLSVECERGHRSSLHSNLYFVLC